MTTYTDAIQAWETFYLLTGTASVTLIGLLFIAISINVELFRNKFSGDLQHFAALTFNSFFYIFILAVLFLIPNITSLGLGISIMVLGILGGINTILQQRRARKNQKTGLKLDIASRFILPILCMGALVLLSVGILFQKEISLYGFVFIIILLLGSASQNAWVLLVELEL
jgi:hypothetical protein